MTFWADEEAALLDPQRDHVIRDSKTPSGAVPISGLRGPIVTDALYRTFKQRGLRIRYVFTIDDYDPVDSQSMKQDPVMGKFMGMPLFTVPSPDPAYSDYARYHAQRYLGTFETLGIRPEEIHWLRDLYGSGALDRQIDLVLRNAAVIRRVYAEVANVVKDESWLPVAVICEQCGRIGTTYATDYRDGTVAYECKPDYVTWAQGCGNKARRSPFGGGAKLYWNLQWCAMWDHFGVTYEEGGKDLLTAGGSRDRANEIYRAVWKKDPPIGLMHEFLNIGGKKISTSRPDEWQQLGIAAHDLATVYPPEVIRFLMLRTDPKRHIDFDPTGNRLPKLMDDLDHAADEFTADPESDLGRIWALSQVDAGASPVPFRVRFSIVADWLQIPSVDPLRKAEERKKAPLTAAERADLEQRIRLARSWLERWAGEDAKFTVQQELPEAARNLGPAQRRFLARAADLVGTATEAEDLQTRLYEVAREVGLVEGEKVSKDAFAAIYLALLGKTIGPRAAWLVVTLPPEFVQRRFREASMDGVTA